MIKNKTKDTKKNVFEDEERSVEDEIEFMIKEGKINVKDDRN